MSSARRLFIVLSLIVVAGAVAAVVVTAQSPAAPVMHTSAAQSLRVQGNQIRFGPGAGRVVQFRGINRSGSEYECLGTDGHYFDSPTPTQPDSNAMISEMVSWGINVVRLPLNEGCWLGINSPSGTNGAPYRSAIEAEVQKLNAHHLFVILALQWNSAGTHPADSPLPMADASHAPTFWRSVAETFNGDGLVMFDLYNEPHGISWSCWLKGCTVPRSKSQAYSYRAAGMQQLVDAVRSTGNRAPLVISGDDYAVDLSGIFTNRVKDPDGGLIYAVHSYGGESPCVGVCLATVLKAAKIHPVVYTEFGEIDCGTSYIDSKMAFLDHLGIGYLAWAWDATSDGWNCRTGPALITNYGGTPTAYGAGYRAHLLALGMPIRP